MANEYTSVFTYKTRVGAVAAWAAAIESDFSKTMALVAREPTSTSLLDIVAAATKIHNTQEGFQIRLDADEVAMIWDFPNHKVTLIESVTRDLWEVHSQHQGSCAQDQGACTPMTRIYKAM